MPIEINSAPPQEITVEQTGAAETDIDAPRVPVSVVVGTLTAADIDRLVRKNDLGAFSTTSQEVILDGQVLNLAIKTTDDFLVLGLAEGAVVIGALDIDNVTARNNGVLGANPTTPIDIWLVMGQSNSIRQNALPAPLYMDSPWILSWAKTSTEWATETGTPWLGSGVARGWLEREARAVDRRVGAIEAGIGGSGFTKITVTVDGNFVTTSWKPTNPDGAAVNLATRARDMALAALAAAPAGSVIKGVIWSQGEADRGQTANGDMATEYGGFLDELIAWFRTELGNPVLPWIISPLTPLLPVLGNTNQTNQISSQLEDTPRRTEFTSFDLRSSEVNDSQPAEYIHWTSAADHRRGDAMINDPDQLRPSAWDQAILNSGRAVSITTTSGSNVITGTFRPSDKYAHVSGPNVPSGTRILQYNSPTQVTMSANAIVSSTADHNIGAPPRTPPSLQVSRSGDTATITWGHPPTRVTSFILETCTDGVGNAWTTRDSANLLPQSQGNAGTFDTDINGWVASTANHTTDRVTTPTRSGSGALRMTSVDGTSMFTRSSVLAAEMVPVVVGQAYYAAAYTRAATVGRSTRVRFDWRDAAGALVSTVNGALATNNTTDWSLREVTAVAPAGAAFLNVWATVISPAAGEVHYWDDYVVYKGTSGTPLVHKHIMAVAAALPLWVRISAVSPTGVSYPSEVVSINGESEIPKALIDAKGDLIVGTAADTPARLAVGADGSPLVPDATQASGWRFMTAKRFEGSGSPEAVVTAPVGSLYTDSTASGANVLWVKGSGTGNTGWIRPQLASQITNVPAGTIASTTVQAALNELDAEKLSLTGGTVNGITAFNGAGASIRITRSTNPADAKIWDFTDITTSGDLNLSALTDAGGVQKNLMSWFRSGRVDIATIAHINGTGSPESVVAAPVGSRYVDTAATTGAVEWVKASGTGTTGWKVVYGDTGWRDIGSLLAADVVANATGGARLRRVGSEVTLQARLNPAAGKVGTSRAVSSAALQIYTPPTGFVPSYPSGLIGSGVAAETSAAFISTRAAHPRIDLGLFVTSGTWASGDLVLVQAKFITADAWPSSLPGSAA